MPRSLRAVLQHIQIHRVVLRQEDSEVLHFRLRDRRGEGQPSHPDGYHLLRDQGVHHLLQLRFRRRRRVSRKLRRRAEHQVGRGERQAPPLRPQHRRGRSPQSRKDLYRLGILELRRLLLHLRRRA